MTVKSRFGWIWVPKSAYRANAKNLRCSRSIGPQTHKRERGCKSGISPPDLPSISVLTKRAMLQRSVSRTALRHRAQILPRATSSSFDGVGIIVAKYQQIQVAAGLNAARATGAYERKLATLARVPLLIVDDFGLKPLRPPADEDIHDLIAERYEQVSTIVTSNLDFAEWDEAFPNNRLLASATIDRLRHNAYCIELEGPSGRNPKVAPPSKSKLANALKSAHS